MNCLNPKFSKPLVVDYYFEMVQKLRFEMYDIDSENCSLQDADYLGELECTLGQVTPPCSASHPSGWVQGSLRLIAHLVFCSFVSFSTRLFLPKH